MDFERNLISKALFERDVVPLLEAKILPDFFEDGEHRKVFEWIMSFWSTYSEVPTAKAVKAQFPSYKVIETTEPYAYYIDELRERREYSLVVEGMQTAHDFLIDKDVESARAAIRAMEIQIGTEVSTLVDENLVETWEDRMKEWRELKNVPNGIIGIPTGFPTIDRTTAGLQGGQVITVIALPKTGKSTLLLRMAISVHQYGESPLFLGFEMSNREQRARHDAMRAGLDHLRITTGRLTPKEDERLERTLRSLKEMPPFLLSSDITASSTVSGVAAKIEQYRPRVLFIDGVYLMDDEESGEKGTELALRNISRGMKRLAQRFDIPVVQTTQSLPSKYNRRKGITADSIGYTSAFFQDSDAIVGLEHTDNEDIKKLRVVEARNCPKVEVMMHWDWTSGEFSEMAEYTGDEDDDEDEADPHSI